ncbi:MAG: hypothetical protein LBP87_04175 [Planctomycetaceae bacterium]|nr:hypothetical protein [Planctomycetaceae bacterium]
MITNSKGNQCFAEGLSPTIGRRTRRQLTLFSDGNENNTNRRNRSGEVLPSSCFIISHYQKDFANY